MKTYYIMISRHFLASYPKAGRETHFAQSIAEGSKIHTIRGSYENWKRKIDEVNEGKAILSLRQWTGSPYNRLCDGSTQVELTQLKAGECGLQALEWKKLDNPPTVLLPHILNESAAVIDGRAFLHINRLATNDGLSEQDFRDWFKGYKLNEPMAIIHFSNFKY